MKLLIIRLQITLIILLAFSPLLYLGLKKLSPQISLYQFDHGTKKESTVSPLKTSGKNIVDASGNPVILRGINLISTNWGDNYQDWNPQAIKVATQDWNINVVRTRVYQHEFEANPASFYLKLETQILNPARENGLYIILHPWFTDNSSLPNQNGIKMWLSIANRYKNDPHIIYDLLAEPRDIAFSDLVSTYTTLIPQLRAITPNSLIMVTGLDWGRDINAWEAEPLPHDNIVYRSNPYNKTAEFPGFFGRMAESYPVVLGEFGTMDKLSMSQTDVANILAYADKLGLGWTAWHFTSSGCPCLLSDEASFTPSPYGELVKQALVNKETKDFVLPTFNQDPDKLMVYTDFLDSGFADYSWGSPLTLTTTIQTNLGSGSGINLNTSRRLNPRNYQSLHLTLNANSPQYLTLRFKSHDGTLSKTYSLLNGDNTIPTTDSGLSSISGIIIEKTGDNPDPVTVSLDNIYFQK